MPEMRHAHMNAAWKCLLARTGGAGAPGGATVALASGLDLSMGETGTLDVAEG